MPRRLQASVACVITAALWLWHRSTLTAVLACIAAALTLLAWLLPRAYAPIQRALDAFAHAVLVAATWTALAVVYFGLFTPLRLFRSLRRLDPLARRFDPSAETYLTPLPKTPPNFTRPF